MPTLTVYQKRTIYLQVWLGKTAEITPCSKSTLLLCSTVVTTCFRTSCLGLLIIVSQSMIIKTEIGTLQVGPW